MVTTRRGARLKSKQGVSASQEDVKSQSPSNTTTFSSRDTQELADKVFAKMKEFDSPDSQGGSVKKQPDLLQLSVPPREAACPTELSSFLQPQLDQTPYFSFDPVRADGTDSSRQASSALYEKEVDSLLKKSVITPDFEKKECAPPINQSRRFLERSMKAAKLKSAGKGWFDLPAPQLTPELKNDLKLLRMRNALDPTRHYKSNDSKKLPRYFQVGRVVSDASEFYSSRIPRKQQKQSLVEELLANEETRQYHRKKYLQLQSKFSSGTKRLKKIKHKKYKK